MKRHREVLVVFKVGGLIGALCLLMPPKLIGIRNPWKFLFHIFFNQRYHSNFIIIEIIF